MNEAYPIAIKLLNRQRIDSSGTPRRVPCLIVPAGKEPVVIYLQQWRYCRVKLPKGLE